MPLLVIQISAACNSNCALYLFLSDPCPVQNIPLVAGSNITISWRESAIMLQSSQPCPCQNLTLRFGSMITRRCGGNYSQGARWEDMDYSSCGLTSRIIQLCEAEQVHEQHSI